MQKKVHIVKAMVFPVVMYVCDSWTIKQAENLRNDIFELFCWIRLLRVPGQQGDQTSQSKGKSVLIFTGRTDAEVEAPIFWPPNAKSS